MAGIVLGGESSDVGRLRIVGPNLICSATANDRFGVHTIQNGSLNLTTFADHSRERGINSCLV
jgi:hypothetical protein